MKSEGKREMEGESYCMVATRRNAEQQCREEC